MFSKIALSILVGVVTGILIWAVGYALVVLGGVGSLATLGAVLKALSVVLGIAAALAYFLFGRVV